MGIINKLFKKVVSVEQTKNKAVELTTRAFYLVERGKFEKAIVCLRKAIKIDSKCGNAYNELAFIYGKIKGDLDIAEEFARKAIDCDPGNLKFWNVLTGIQMIRLKNLRTKQEIRQKVSESLRTIEQLIANNPNYPPIYLTKAQALATMGEPRNVWEKELKKAEFYYLRNGITGAGTEATSALIETIISRNRSDCERLSDVWNKAS